MSVPLNTKQWGQHTGFGVVKNVPVDKLEFSQHYMDEDKINTMARSDMTGWDIPIGAEVGDHVLVEDGHHRAAALIKKGRKYVPIRVY